MHFKNRFYSHTRFTILLVLAVSGMLSCDKRTTGPISASQHRPVYDLKSPMSRLLFDQLSKATAIALGDKSLRESLGRTMALAGHTDEMKLEFSSHLHSGTGAVLLVKIAHTLGIGPDSLKDLLESLPSIEFYMPVREHRRAWEGGTVLVASQPRESDPIIAYDSNGQSVQVSASEPPAMPTFVLVGSETDFSAPVGPRHGLDHCRARSILCGSVGEAAGGTRASLSTVPTSAPYGYYMTYSNIADVGESWPRGDPELEVWALGPGSNQPFSTINPLWCAGQSESGYSYFDQNSHTWSGAVLIARQDSMIANGIVQLGDPRGLVVGVWEDDNQACAIHDSDADAQEAITALVFSGVATAIGISDTVRIPQIDGTVKKYPNSRRPFWAGLAGMSVTVAGMITDGDDDFLGWLVNRSLRPNMVVANCNYLLEKDTASNNGGVQITYHTEDIPPGDYPPNLIITGPSTVVQGESATWVPFPTNLPTPYLTEFHWTGPVDRTAGWLTTALETDTTIRVEVTDATGSVYTAEFMVHVEPPPEQGCEPGTCTRKLKRPPGSSSNVLLEPIRSHANGLGRLANKPNPQASKKEHR